jgi:hypothetical protein
MANQSAAFVIYPSCNHQTSPPAHANNKKNNHHALFATTTQEPQTSLVFGLANMLPKLELKKGLRSP